MLFKIRHCVAIGRLPSSIVLMLCLLLIAKLSAYSQSGPTLCATASVQLSQNATLDRQAFIATMTITNGLPTPLTGVNITVNFTDSNGYPVTDTINNPPPAVDLFFISLNNGSTDNLSRDDGLAIG